MEVPSDVLRYTALPYLSLADLYSLRSTAEEFYREYLSRLASADTTQLAQAAIAHRDPELVERFIQVFNRTGTLPDIQEMDTLIALTVEEGWLELLDYYTRDGDRWWIGDGWWRTADAISRSPDAIRNLAKYDGMLQLPDGFLNAIFRESMDIDTYTELIEGISRNDLYVHRLWIEYALRWFDDSNFLLDPRLAPYLCRILRAIHPERFSTQG